MNIFLNEYFGFWFELNHFSARFNEKMNFQNVSPTPRSRRNLTVCLTFTLPITKAVINFHFHQFNGFGQCTFISVRVTISYQEDLEHSGWW